MKTIIQVNGKDVEITLTKEQVEKIKKLDLKITDRVKTIQDVYDIIKPSGDVVSILNYEGFHPTMIAAKNFAIAELICEALNEGWVPNWKNSSEYKYYPWFNIDHPCSGFSFYGYVRDSARSGVVSRLCFKSRELAEYAGKQFTAIYKEFMTK